MLQIIINLLDTIKNGFAEVSKNFAGCRFENNFVGLNAGSLNATDAMLQKVLTF